MLAFAGKLNDSPASISDEDVTSLHAAGLTDEQVWELAFTVSIFNMFNRMADAFGLQTPEQATAALERD
jgi:alkylhydroperoxidase family enzyme